MSKRIKTMVNSFESCYNEIVEELNQRVTDTEEFNKAVAQVERRETALKRLQQEFEERFKERLIKGESAIKKLTATEKELALARSEIEKYKIQVSVLNDRIEELEKGQDDAKLQEAIEDSEELTREFGEVNEELCRKYSVTPTHKTSGYYDTDSDDDGQIAK